MATQNIQVTVPDSGPAQPKGGWMTSEAQVMAAVAAAITGMTSAGAMPEWLAITLAALSGVYKVSRTALKSAHAAGYAKGVADLPELPAGIPQQPGAPK